MKKDKKGAKSPEEHEPNARKSITYNRRARHEYEILETYDAGIVLVGTEVKSLRASKVNIQDAFARVEKGEVWIYNMHISPYELGNRWNVEPLRRRKALLHAEEIEELRRKSEQKGLTIVPLHLYFQRGFAKLQIGLGRGKQLHDKRESIAERDQNREAQRQLSSRD